MYSQVKKEAALNVFHETNSVTKTIQIMGYPTRRQLYSWIVAENAPPKERKRLPRIANSPQHPRNPSLEIKLDAIKRCFECGESVKYVSEDIGYTRASIYQWRKRYLKEGTLGLMNNKNIPSGQLKKGTTPSESIVAPSNEVAELKAQMLEMQMEIDILKETINVLKKDPGIDQEALSNREKAVIIDALKTKYSLPHLLKKLRILKSSYYYQEKVLIQPDKYFSLRIHIKELFTENKNRYGYRRIHALLKREGIVVSEKIIRRIMQEENLVVKVKKTAKYNSYAGEVTPAVQHKIERNFSAEKPNRRYPWTASGSSWKEAWHEHQWILVSKMFRTIH